VSFFPAVRERVLIQGSDDIFLVVSVDLERGVADLIPIRDGGQPAEDVPLSIAASFELAPRRRRLSLAGR